MFDERRRSMAIFPNGISSVDFMASCSMEQQRSMVIFPNGNLPSA
jgi:hypothetical protein